MMKRGISLVTSLLMTASVFSGAASQAFTSRVPAVFAAAVQPVIGIGNEAQYKGITTVGYGQKTVSVPVIIKADDLAAMKVEVSVTSDNEKEANPVITGIRAAGIPELSVDEKKGNTRVFLWNSKDVANVAIDSEVIAYVDIELPYDDATTKDSTYTVAINKQKLDCSNHEQTAGYGFDMEASDLVEKIAFNSNSDSNYKLTFSSLGADEKWHSAKKIAVKPGQEAEIGLEIACPTSAISGLKYKFNIDEKLSFEGFDTESGLKGNCAYETSETKPNLVWNATGEANKTGIKIDESTHFVTLKVKVPANAAAGDTFPVSLSYADTSTNDQIQINPASLPEVTLVVESSADLSIATKTISAEAAKDVVKLPVYIKNADAATVLSKFEATNGAEIVSIEQGSDVAGDFQISESVAKALWNSKDAKNQKFSAKDSEIFVLSVKLPETAKAGDKFDVKFIKDSVDVADEDQIQLVPATKDGQIIIASYEALMTIGDVEDVTLTEKTSVKVPVKMTAEALQTVTGKFTLSVADGEVSVNFENGDAACVLDNEAIQAALTVALNDAKFNVTCDRAFTANIVAVEELVGKLSASESNPAAIVWNATESGDKLGMNLEDADFANVVIELVPEEVVPPVTTTVSEEVTTTASEEVTTVSSDVTTVSSDVTTVSSDVTTVSSDVTTVSSDVTTVSSDVTTVSSDVTTVSSDVTTVSSDVTTVSSDVTTVSSDVTTVSSEVTPPVVTVTEQPAVPQVPVNPADLIPAEYEPEFYYAHEESFDLADFYVELPVQKYKLNDDATANVPDGEPVPVKIPGECFQLVDADKAPVNTYNGETFIYSVPSKIVITEEQAKAISTDPKVVEALLSEKTASIVIPVPAYIGQKGDYDLSHEVEQDDATLILKDSLAADLELDTVIESKIAAGAKKEIPEKYLVKFAKFLADCDENKELEQDDATALLQALLISDLADEEKISVETWNEVLKK